MPERASAEPEGQPLLSFEIKCGYFEYRRSIREAAAATPALTNRFTMRWAIVNLGSLGATFTKLRHPLKYVVFANGIRVTSHISEWFTSWSEYAGWSGDEPRVWLLYEQKQDRSMIPDASMKPSVSSEFRTLLLTHLGAAIHLPPLRLPELEAKR